MAAYTIELREVVKHYPIFPVSYDFYNEHKRREFEENFIRHFYFREIGCETPERFIHYLEDKMRMVFPYYNELMKTAEIEYSVLDNYNLTETFERSSERKQRGNAASYGVGVTRDSSSSETDETRNGETSGNVQSIGNHSEKETTNVEGTEKSTGSDSKTANFSNVKDDTESRDTGIVKKFLDTPQGKLDLDSTDYLTTLNQDTEGVERTAKETNTGNSSESGTNSRNGESTTDTTRNLTGNDTQSQSSEGTDKMNGKTSVSAQGESQVTQDNNTRTESEADHSERYVLNKKGNIGVDTDADMIQKHINLQKVLRRIEQMFFDECEDLFMLVF